MTTTATVATSKPSITIALIGLPSSGKSSIVNALIGKRMAQSERFYSYSF